MKFALPVTLLALVLIAYSCSDTEPLGDNFFTVSGVVLDRTSDTPIPEAEILISAGSGLPAELFTDSLGTFGVTFAARYSVTREFKVAKDGYSPLDTTLVVTQDIEVVWKLDRVETE